MKNIFKSSALLIAFIIATSFSAALASDRLSSTDIISNEYFDIFSREYVDFEPTGRVCEQAALIELERNYYPRSQYRIEQGISYFRGVETVGELDLVVFDKVTDEVLAVGEVKCWKNLKGALRKAKQQQQRFKESLFNKITIKSANGATLSLAKFKNIKDYFSIAQEGAINAGFTYELPLNFKEFMTLRGRLLDCKVEGKCPRK